ncbi:4-hydroxy-3-methylbut-2-enyl diphosphate reductase [Nonomuraea solani]|uniref:4-hydroxy-3-methylbut-2-enyl diphosphate reductase n=1 Tax=Nonomuraea solani TaxID=1144553 RepID=A0A1H6EDU2_9ACTN|nr:hypothetical protein [Nonomuraea solani]SEG95423.1 4-hydroxy-3-methylbut-2-enyl diphosphate reductase [Nonomuraea solani]
MSTQRLLSTRRILLATPPGCARAERAVEIVAPHSDVVLVIGSGDDAPGLIEVARRYGAGSAHLIGGAADLRGEWLPADGIIGVTAGASAPGSLVRELLGTLARHGYTDIEGLTAS